MAPIDNQGGNHALCSDNYAVKPLQLFNWLKLFGGYSKKMEHLGAVIENRRLITVEQTLF
jgi:hypothetical protein